jgi:hypothetical protein
LFGLDVTPKKGRTKTPQKKAKSVLKTLYVTKLLLSAQSEYFRALFESGFKEADQKSVRDETVAYAQVSHSFALLD